MTERNSNSAHPAPLRLPLLTIGFCTDLAGEEKLRAAGVERIWRRGDGNNCLDDALYEFRERGGALAVTDDLRTFGLKRRAILSKVSAVTKAGIEIVNIDHPEMDSYQLVDQAIGALHAAAPMPNHRTARRRGRFGGLAKAAAAALGRAAMFAPEVARRLCARKELTWAIKAEILGIPISTAQRHYGPASVAT